MKYNKSQIIYLTNVNDLDFFPNFVDTTSE